MYSELNKGEMPPKKAREKNPDLIPTKEQIEIIKKWSESFQPGLNSNLTINCFQTIY